MSTPHTTLEVYLSNTTWSRKWRSPSRGFPTNCTVNGMRAYQTWDEAKTYFAASRGSKRHPEVGTAVKDLALADVNLREFLTSKYLLWPDLRTSDDDRLHGSGRRIENASEGITIQITKKAEAAGTLNIYLERHGCATQY